MIYQQDLKREVAASKGLREDCYDHWTYEDWKRVRDAYLVAEGRAISLEGAAEARRTQVREGEA